MLRVADRATVLVRPAGARPSTMPVAKTTKANSPAGARTRAVSSAGRAPSPHSRARAKITPVLTAVRARARPKTLNGSAAMASRSSPRPTPTKKTPSNSPLNGSIDTSTSRRNSVSARRTPATRAPMLMDRPLAWAASPAPTTTSRLAATNSSPPWAALRALATERNMGRSTTRPSRTSRPSPTAAGIRVNSDRPRMAASSAPPCWATAARTVTVDQNGGHRQVLGQQDGEGRTADHALQPSRVRPAPA